MTGRQGHKGRSENPGWAGDISSCKGTSGDVFGGFPLHPRIRRLLLETTSPASAPRIGAAQDMEERMLMWGEGMETRFISWNAAALQTFDFTFLDKWSRKKLKLHHQGIPRLSAGHWNDVYSPADYESSLKWPMRETMVMLEVATESRGGIYLTVEEVAPLGEKPVELS